MSNSYSNYLKSFSDGEAILSDETNSNNQYLLNQINSVASSVRNEVEQMLSEFQGDFVQAGFIIALPFDVIPAGYLKCDGSSLLRSEYSDLFNAIGTIYGYTDNTHFNIPNFQGAFLRGYGGNSSTFGTKQMSAAPNVTITVPTTYVTSTLGNTSSGYIRHNTAKYKLSTNNSYVSGNSVYQDGINEIRPDNYAVNWIIKY